VTAYLQHPIVVGAIGGAVGAARADFKSFKAFQSIDEFLAYDWKIAAFRVVQGAIIGAVMGAGLGL
jgi:hypothetical protein